MKVRIVLRIGSLGLPAIVTVRNGRGRLLFYGRARGRLNVLQFCTRERFLVVAVKPINSAYPTSLRFIKLSLCACQTHYLTFPYFEPACEPEVEETFYLSDERYGFPVESALLSFTKE